MFAVDNSSRTLIREIICQHRELPNPQQNRECISHANNLCITNKIMIYGAIAIKTVDVLNHKVSEVAEDLNDFPPHNKVVTSCFFWQSFMLLILPAGAGRYFRFSLRTKTVSLLRIPPPEGDRGFRILPSKPGRSSRSG